jgi:hypothetical protein
MSGTVQALIVAVLVTACVSYSSWRLMSAGLRLRVLGGLSRVPGIGRAAWFLAWQARVQSRLAAGCATCAPQVTSAASRKQTPGVLRRS